MIFCIDMKSFFASVECSLRKLNPMTTPLVVCDESRGKGALIMATSPILKKRGIASRCRLFEIPSDVKCIKAKPRMKKYIEYAGVIHNIFLKYVSCDDIHTYSIDESFLDVSSYLKYYGVTPKELALKILGVIKESLGIIAVCGAGDNLFMAKVALDLYAKHDDDLFFYLSLEYFKKVTWYHDKLTDIWQIGNGISKRLNKLGLYNLSCIASCDVEILKKEFGIIGVDLFNRSWGIDDVKISDIKAYKPDSKSMSRSQVLFRDYTKEEAWIVLCEMIYLLCVDLVRNNLACGNVFFGVYYNDDNATGKSFCLDYYSNDYFYIKNNIKRRYFTYVECCKIRVISIGFSSLVDEKNKIINLFDLDTGRFFDLSKSIIEIWERFGKNKIVLGTACLEESTLYLRNGCIGGHNSDV